MILHMDDFSGYGTEIDLMMSGVYAGAMGSSIGAPDSYMSLVPDVDGVSPGRVLLVGKSGQNSRTLVRKVFPGPRAVAGAMTRVWFPALPASGVNYPLTFLGGGVASLWTLVVTATGGLQVRTGISDPVYTSDGPVITAQGWWHLEMKVVISETEGSIEVRAEGIPVPGLVHSNINTGSELIQQAALGQSSGTGGFGYDHYQKDWVVWDGEGDFANDFLGTCILHRHSLTADEALNWTPVGGLSGHDILNSDPPTPSAYLYAEDDPLPGAYQAAISPLPEDIVSVKAVQLRYMAAKNDGGDASVQTAIVSDPSGTADVALGPERPVTIAQTFWQDVFHTDPKTGAPWIPSALDAANVRLDRIL